MKSKPILLSKKVGELLRKRKLTLAAAESCTGGLFSSVITDVSGSSDYFLGGIVSYSTAQKEKLLHIPKPALKKYSAVSAQVTLLMAKNVKKLVKSDIAVAITGYAGPGGGTKKDPKGTVYIAVVFKVRALAKKYHFKGSRIQVKRKAVEKAFDLVQRVLRVPSSTS